MGGVCRPQSLDGQETTTTLGRPRLTAPEINDSRGGTMPLFLPP